MASIRFLIQGSETKPYTVMLVRVGYSVSASCTCRAGILGQHCKHKIMVLSGETAGIVDGLDRLPQVKELISGTDVEEACKQYLAAERECEAVKNKLAKCKKRLVNLLAGKA